MKKKTEKKLGTARDCGGWLVCWRFYRGANAELREETYEVTLDINMDSKNRYSLLRRTEPLREVSRQLCVCVCA